MNSRRRIESGGPSMTEPAIGKGTRFLWWCFALSLIAGTALAIGEFRRSSPASSSIN